MTGPKLPRLWPLLACLASAMPSRSCALIGAVLCVWEFLHAQRVRVRETGGELVCGPSRRQVLSNPVKPSHAGQAVEGGGGDLPASVCPCPAFARCGELDA